MRKVFLVLLSAAMTAGFMSVCEAQVDGNIVVHRTSSVQFGNSGIGGNGFFNGWAWGPFGVNNSLGYVPAPPYFALHPPVYYSHNVAVPYGMSPYPIRSYSPSTTVVAERATPEPLVVVNPYVDQEIASKKIPAEAVSVEQPVMKIVDSEGSAVQIQRTGVIENEL